MAAYLCFGKLPHKTSSIRKLSLLLLFVCRCNIALQAQPFDHALRVPGLSVACPAPLHLLPDGDLAAAALVGEEHMLSDMLRGDREGAVSGHTSTLSGRCASRLYSCASRNMDSSCTDSMVCCCCRCCCACWVPGAADEGAAGTPSGGRQSESGVSTPHRICSWVAERSMTARTSWLEISSEEHKQRQGTE